MRQAWACCVLALAATSFIIPGAARGVATAPAPVPALDRWEARMGVSGRALCDYLAEPRASDEMLEAIYYDAERVFYQIADYSSNRTWFTCAQRAEAVYREYVFHNGGRVPGYWNFTTGLRIDYERTGDVQSKSAALLLSVNAAFARDGTPLAWTQSGDDSREVAYAILSYINAEALGEPKRRRRIDLVNQAYDHMAQWFVRFAWPGPWQQSPTQTSRLAPFMVGLTAHTLIRDWEQTQDSRLLPALRLAADWMWANAWIPTAASFWYDSNSISGGGAPDLNLLIAPIYAFLYWQTGDTKYRDEGDQIFAGGVAHAFLGNGKQFDQNYWWSFDYVKWRRALGGSSPRGAPASTDNRWTGWQPAFGE